MRLDRPLGHGQGLSLCLWHDASGRLGLRSERRCDGGVGIDHDLTCATLELSAMEHRRKLLFTETVVLKRYLT